MAASSNGTPASAEPPSEDSSPLLSLLAALPLCFGLDSHSKDCHARARRWLVSRVVPPPVAVPLGRRKTPLQGKRPRYIRSPMQGGSVGRCCLVLVDFRERRNSGSKSDKQRTESTAACCWNDGGRSCCYFLNAWLDDSSPEGPLAGSSSRLLLCRCIACIRKEAFRPG